ncbi:MarR family transcriptional regulator [Cryobacterium lactosi]|uniref:MarR family transcriptional regulator n=2 Tax=Cryobacterium lactosi TaxID=1259202 RepID=A0A4R9BIL5_9MICO|nr:MarR family transcriptional regulator [Cryobacterium lactosi]
MVMTENGDLPPAAAPGDPAQPSGSDPDSAEALAEVEEQMMQLAAYVRGAMRDTALRIDPALQPFGLKILRMLRRCGPTHASAVAEALEVDRSVISRQARLLEDLGLLELAADPADGRAKYLAATPLAIEKMAAVPGGDKSLLHGRLAGWPEADLHNFALMLKRLNSPDGAA